MDSNVKNVENYLRKIYYTPESPVAFSSFSALKSFLKRQNLQISDEFLSDWLNKQIAYSLHKEKIKTFIRNKIFVMRIDEQWQCDLVDMQPFVRENENFKYLLTCIDIFSKYAWVIPLKSKNANDIIFGFKSILAQRKPEKLQFDMGKEFNNKFFKAFLIENNIQPIVCTNNILKCVVVERFHRTLKAKMYKFFTANNTRRYIDVLQRLVKGYNENFHSKIKTAPSLVTTSNEKEIFYTTYKKDLKNGPKAIPLLSVGDKVRVFDYRHVFQKGFRRRWTDEVFVVKSIVLRPLNPMYVLEDYKKRQLEKRFYIEELQKVHPSSKMRVYKRYKSKISEGSKEELVKLKGYPSMEPVWISSSKLA